MAQKQGAPPEEALSPRERLLRAAVSLFYERGVPSVGINEVISRAGVARMTLYNNFASKEDLARAALERLAAEQMGVIEAHLAGAPKPARKIRAMFDAAEALAEAPGFRGCAVINMAAQSPDPRGAIRDAVRDHKRRIQNLFEAIARDGGVSDAKSLPQQLATLWDGGLVDAHIQGSTDPIRAARRAARALFRAAREAG